MNETNTEAPIASALPVMKKPKRPIYLRGQFVYLVQTYALAASILPDDATRIVGKAVRQFLPWPLPEGKEVEDVAIEFAEWRLGRSKEPAWVKGATFSSVPTPEDQRRRRALRDEPKAPEAVAH